MTIAIGIVANDGIVIAADREENDNYLTGERGKILQTFKGGNPVGWIAIAGAGNGPEIDEVSKRLTETFCAGVERSSDEIRNALKSEHRTYYKKTILPFSRLPYPERPDYSLIIGCLDGGIRKSLFATSRLAFNESGDYDAVGIGSMVANNWLGRLYDNMSLLCATRLAAYVIYQVKNSVSGCGLGTDVIILQRGKLLARVNPEVIRKWEAAFRSFPSLERNVFSYCIGADSNLQVRTKPDMESVTLGMNKMREVLSEKAADDSI